MADYLAIMMHADNRGDDSKISFTGADDLMSKTPVKIIRACFEHIDNNLFPQDSVEWELNSAMKSKSRPVVTAMGSFHVGDGGDLPFMMMISPKS